MTLQIISINWDKQITMLLIHLVSFLSTCRRWVLPLLLNCPWLSHRFPVLAVAGECKTRQVPLETGAGEKTAAGILMSPWPSLSCLHQAHRSVPFFLVTGLWWWVAPLCSEPGVPHRYTLCRWCLLWPCSDPWQWSHPPTTTWIFPHDWSVLVW